MLVPVSDTIGQLEPEERPEPNAAPRQHNPAG